MKQLDGAALLVSTVGPRLVGGGGFHDRSCASARHERHPPHRGLGRITRIWPSSRLTTALAVKRRLTSKIHHLVDGAGRPLVVLVSAGQAHDGPVFEHLLAHLKVDRGTAAAPRTRPDRVRGDKAYSSRATRAQLRRRRIVAVIPEPSDQVAPRKRRGSRGGRPPAFDAEDYKRRNVIERNFNVVKQWRGLARNHKLATVYRAGTVLRAITIWLPYLSDTP
jgi:transposase